MEHNQPPRKVTRNIKGQIRDYYYLTSVNSMEELETLRFKKNCLPGGKPLLPTFESYTMPCTRKRRFLPGIQCKFELLALPRKSVSGTIDVYTHGKHNHLIKSEEQRALKKSANKLVPAENPPKIHITPDKIQWTYLHTFANYDRMQTYRDEIYCKFRGGRGEENHQRIRFPCNCRDFNCKFQILALKTTKQGYHVYTSGLRNHSHLAIKPKKKQQPAAWGRQKKQQQMAVAQEEEDDDIIVIDDVDEDDGIEVEHQQQEEKRQGSMEITEIPLENEANPGVEPLKEKVQKAVANAKVYYEWMAGIQPNEIGLTVMDLDTASVLEMVQMADQEIHQYPAKFDWWHPWLKHAMQKCLSEVEDFANKYKHLLGLMLHHGQA